MLTLSSGVGQTDAEQWSVAKLRRSGTDMKNSASLSLLLLLSVSRLPSPVQSALSRHSALLSQQTL